MSFRTNALFIFCALNMVSTIVAEPTPTKPPSPVITMPGSSKPLSQLPVPAAPPNVKIASTFASASATAPAVQMQVLVLGDDVNDYSYKSITTHLTVLGVPYVGIPLDTVTPDSKGNRLTNIAFTNPTTGQGLYQGLIYTDSTFSPCNPTCTTLLTNTDWTTLSNYISQYNIRVVTYYTYPDPKWGLTPVSGAGYSSSNPLQVKLTSAGASIFSYINAANSIPVAGSGGPIWAYKANATAAAGETTTPILTTGSNVVGVTHVNTSGQQSLSLTMDNYPTLLHSLAFSYGVINWVTNGVFLGQRQVYINPQDDDILLGDRLYAPTLPQCPDDPSCPVIIGTSTDMQALANWQNTKHQDPQVPYLKTSYAFVGQAAAPGYAPVPDTVPGAMTSLANDFGWVTHTWTHGNIDCFTMTPVGACVPETLDQAFSEIELNAVFGQSVGIPADTTGLVTPFNGGLDNLAFFQAAQQEGITSIISPNNPPSPGTGAPGIVPSILLIPRRTTNLFYDVDSPSTGVPGSLPDEYNANYGPNGITPLFSSNQTYSQIISNESTVELQTRMLFYEVYPLGFHMSNSIAYDGTHSLLSDLMDSTISKYEALFTLPIYTLKDMRDIATLLLNRASFNNSGATGVYTPGVSVVLTTNNAAVIPVTGACSQAFCPTYGGQMQDSVSMPANSSVTLSLSAGVGVGLSTVTVNPGTVNNLTPSQGLVSLNGVPSVDTVVSLSSNSAAAVVPSSVTVHAGNMGAAFTVATGVVSTSTTVTIRATYNGVSKTTSLTIVPASGLVGISMNPLSVPAGNTSTGTVTLSSSAPSGGAVVSLLSNNTAAVAPVNVTVNAGTSSGTFNVSTLAVGTATSGNIVGIYNGVNSTAPLTVNVGEQLAIASVTLNPPGVVGGSVSTGTVTLNGLAPAAGQPVTLSSNSSSASVQSPVWVTGFSNVATFTINTKAVSNTTNATISATLNGTQTAVLAISPSFGLASVSLNPGSVVGGASSTGTVTLTAPAPVGGTVVSLSSNNAAALVPSSVMVNAGVLTATFTVTTNAVTSGTTATISATYGSGTQTAALVISSGTAVSLSSLSLNPAGVTGGSTSTGTVTLSGAAPGGGAVVSLSSNNAAATVPATVTVNSGSTTATFTVTTTAVTSAASVTIGATYSGVNKTATLTISPSAVLSSVSLNPAGVTGGSTSTGTVTLGSAAPGGGAVVSLSSNNAAATVPATVTVNSGSTTATFTVVTTAVTATASVTIGATYGGVNKTATLTISPSTALSSVSLNPASVPGGTSSTGTVTLSSTAPTGGAVVSLSSNNAAATVPSTVTVNAGSTTATFTVTTKAVTTSTSVTISATYNSVNKTAALTVAPAATLSTLSLSPTSVVGGNSSTGTVTLAANAPTGGIPVSLSSNNAAATVPATVTVNAGSKTATFTITTKSVAATTSVTIGATYGTVSKTATLTVTAGTNPIIGEVSFNPTSVSAGSSSTGTITLTGPALTGGAVVSLSSNNTAVVVPATVTVNAGSTTATFTAITNGSNGSTNAIVTGTYNGVNETAALAVTPGVSLQSMSVSPSTVTRGSTATATVTLSGAAPAGGIVVALTSWLTNVVTVPATMTVPAGATSGTFTVTTVGTGSYGQVTITAAYNGVNANAVFTVN